MVAYQEVVDLDAEPLLEGDIDDIDLEKSGLKLRNDTLLGRIWSKVRCGPGHFKVLIPSFLNREPSGGAPKRVNKTAWLDGLRGVAAFIVFIYHFQYAHHTGWKIGYGGGNGKNDHYIGQLPFIRILFQGSPMVFIFWVISGAALSLRPLQLARSRSYEKLMLSLFSSVFRRFIRLYLPCFVVSFCIMIVVFLGAYDPTLKKDWPFDGTNESQPVKLPTIGAQLYHWVKNVWSWANPFEPRRHEYDPHYWTIPREFKYSIVLFATQAGAAKLKPLARTILLSLIYVYCMVINQQPFALFIGGMICAEYILSLEERKPEFITDNEQLAHSEHWTNRFAQQTRWIRKHVPSWPMWLLLFIFSLHLIGFPHYRPWQAYGYYTLDWLTPSFVEKKTTFYWSLGSTLIVFPLAAAPFLQRIFSNPLSVYLGHISFALYIVHGPVNHIIGYRLVPVIWSITGKEWVWQYELGLFLSWLVVATIVIWLADLVTRVVDQPTVKFGRWLQQLCEVKLQA
jgi:peptidoglycan/LPS O-acetylase OafA/YrhL